MPPLPARDIARMRELRYGDGLTALEVAAVVGRCTTAIYRYAPGQPGKVSNESVRRLFQESGLTAYELARRMGWKAGRVKADSSRVRRTLGLLDDVSGSNGLRSRRSMIDAETAGLLAEAMGHAAWEAMPLQTSDSIAIVQGVPDARKD